jgi:hypothetical protein
MEKAMTELKDPLCMVKSIAGKRIDRKRKL